MTTRTTGPRETPSPEDTLRVLTEVVNQLSVATRLEDIERAVPPAARSLTGADGATFVLSEGDLCHYKNEDAIAPLWKGERFPIETCISGWAIRRSRAVAIEDIYADERVPHDAYRPTFVKSLLMVPIRTASPLGAIGMYWADPHMPTEREQGVAQALADSSAVALEHLRVRRELERTVQLSETDALTGLLNRRGWDSTLESALESGVEPLCVALIDLDWFKDYNDRHGHLAGDEHLRAAARSWRGVLRSGDVLARFGGEEFALLLPACQLDGAREIADRLRRATPEGETASVGIARWDGTEDARSLIARADQALYAAKQAGRDRVLTAPGS